MKLRVRSPESGGKGIKTVVARHADKPGHLPSSGVLAIRRRRAAANVRAAADTGVLTGQAACAVLTNAYGPAELLSRGRDGWQREVGERTDSGRRSGRRRGGAGRHHLAQRPPLRRPGPVPAAGPQRRAVAGVRGRRLARAAGPGPACGPADPAGRHRDPARRAGRPVAGQHRPVSLHLGRPGAGGGHRPLPLRAGRSSARQPARRVPVAARRAVLRGLQRTHFSTEPGHRAAPGRPPSALEPGCTRINLPSVHTIYPPVAEAYFTAVDELSPAGPSPPIQAAGALCAIATSFLLVIGLRPAGPRPAAGRALGLVPGRRLSGGQRRAHRRAGRLPDRGRPADPGPAGRAGCGRRAAACCSAWPSRPRSPRSWPGPRCCAGGR